MDLRVLLAARIRQIVFCPADEALEHTLDTWNRSGDAFTVISATPAELATSAFHERLRVELERGNAPIVTIAELAHEGAVREQVETAVISSAVDLGAKKIFFPGAQEGLEIDGKFRSYPTVTQVREALESGALLNIPRKRIEFLIDQQELHGVDVVIVEAKRGEIYEEVFTHSGSGTLFSREYPNILRPAREGDVRDIMAIMQPYIAEGSLKPVSEEELLRLMRTFMVYSVNDQIIAAGALIEYGDSFELAKLCTLPRYQARGRARALVRALLDEARFRGKRSVFALTVQGYVGEFFERLGFQPVERETLPGEWKAGYDFTRQSKAYRYWLGEAEQRDSTNGCS
jgi:N-acetylglutamate synthase-like GNAT family acetyltransferase